MSRLAQDWQGAYAGHYPTMKSAMYVSREEFLAHALDVYKLATKDLCPPDREPWMQGDGSWSTAEGFCESLMFRMGERLRRRAVLTGHLLETPWPDSQDDTDTDCSPGRSLGQTMGHGCPALPAGGPGCETDQGVQGPCTPTAVTSSVEATP